MTTDLRDELARLAEDTPRAAPPGDLWARGVRRQRRSRALTGLAAAAAVLMAVGVSTVGWDAVRTTEPIPTAADARAIPNRLEAPSPFAASTADGPIGPLAVIAGAEQATGWSGGSANGLVGVSATTGEYRFLDLPGLVAEGDDPFAPDRREPELSPDGRSVAYWLGKGDHPDRVGGFAVYDTVSGEVTRHEVDSDLGLSADGLQWLDEDIVLVTFGKVVEIRDDGGAAQGIRSRLWSPSSDLLTDVEGNPSLWKVSPLDSGFAGLGSNALRFWDRDTGERVARTLVTGGGQDLQEIAVDPSGRTVVAVKQTSSTITRHLLVGAVGDSVTLEPLRAEVEVWQLLGWQGAGNVIARGVVPGTGQREAAVYAVDLTTGAARELVREARESWGAFPQYASELWDRPTVSRPGPDRVLDPRLRAAGAATLVVVLGGLVLLVRRRRARA